MTDVITSNAPITVPAVDSQVYDTWWVKTFRVDASSAVVPVTVQYQLCYMDDSGLPVFYPGPPTTLIVPDIFAAAAADNTGVISTAIDAIITACGQIGFQQGVIS